MQKLNESAIEQLAIEILQQQGFIYTNGSSIALGSEASLRKSLSDVLLIPILEKVIERINPTIPAYAREDALKQVLRISSTNLMDANENFHRMLTEGVKVSYQKEGTERGDIVWLVDYTTPDNNDFRVVNQYTVKENNNERRPDTILFINGFPLVLIELKNAIDKNATMQSAYQQIRTYKEELPTLFTYNSIVIISDGLEAKAGTISSDYSRFMAWKTTDGKSTASNLISEMETLIEGMLHKATLLDIIRHFIVFEKSSTIDPENKITTLTTIKKLAGYHQYYAVNNVVESVHTATQEKGSRKAGVVWHTQGSGKSLSMVFAVGKLVLSLDNPTILIITDRNDLDDQLFNTFAASKQLLRQSPVQAENREQLKSLLNVASGGVVFSTIQKFSPEEGNIYEELSNRRNILVIADEAHRTQYGFNAKTIDDKDKHGNIIGKKVVYGFAKYMRDALPNATYLGFTGTPIEKEDSNTRAVFGDYIAVYDIVQAVKDGATVGIFYESRLAKITLSDEGKKLVQELDYELEKQDIPNKQKAEWTQLETVIGSEKRIKRIAEDIVTHFEIRQSVCEGKAMIVAMSRRIACLLYKEIRALRPHWHNDALQEGLIKVVITAQASDGPDMAKHHTTKEERRILANRMKNPHDALELAIVCDMWLTGFDVPSMHTLYIDKPMKGHSLMQAITRVNRVYKDKPGGLIVDYLGIASDLKKALSFYSDNGGKGNPAEEQKEVVSIMLEKLEVVSQLFHGFDYTKYFTADTSQKLAIILTAEDYILGLENGKKRFIDEVSALSKAFVIAIPHEKAISARDEIAFFQAIKIRLHKFENSTFGNTTGAIETTIKQVIDKALVSSKVIDIFDAAGIKKPNISILSDEFLLEIKNMEHKNIALEILKKLLKDEIQSSSKKNLVQSRSLMEMLESSITKYHNKMITATQVIEELIGIAKETVRSGKEADEMGLTEYEYAFYTAVASNNSARELMEKDILRELAIVLTKQIRENASIDWTMKESVRAQLRVIVKRTLRKFRYPPDMQKLATDTVLEQAELLANEITNLKERKK